MINAITGMYGSFKITEETVVWRPSTDGVISVIKPAGSWLDGFYGPTKEAVEKHLEEEANAKQRMANRKVDGPSFSSTQPDDRDDM